MPYLDVQGGKLYYETAGEAREDRLALIFVHAGIANLRMWDQQVPAFAQEFRVVRCDTRGFGKTTSEDIEFSDRADLLALLDHLDIERAVLLGCSRGGQMCIDFTIDHPERVAALVTVCASPGALDFEDMPKDQAQHFAKMGQLWQTDPKGDEMRAFKLTTWIDGFHRRADEVDAGVRERVLAMLVENDQVVNAGKPIELDLPSAGRLGEIHVPTLVIVGALDNAYILYAGDVMANEIAGARKVVIANATHLPNMEHPDEFNRTVLHFLEGVTVAS